MTRLRWAVAVAGGVFGTVALGQVTQPSPIFGFVRATLNGSGVQGGVTMLGPTFVEGVVAEAVLQAGAARPYEMTATGVTWAAGAFATQGGPSSHYVEVKSSSNLSAVGMMSDIVSHTATTLTIADDWSAVLRGGETVVIRPHKTLGGVFGAANEAGLGSGDPTTADVLSVLSEGSTAAFSTYYYRAGSPLGGTGWRSSANPFDNQASLPLRTGQGLIVKRRQAAPLEVLLQGFVKTGVWRRPLPKGYSLVDPLAPLTDQRGSLPMTGAAFVLGSTSGSGVISSGLGATLSSGTSQSADLVSLAGTVAGFYLATPSGLSSGGWRLTSNPFVDQQDTVIPATSALLIQNRGLGKTWSRPQPFVVTAP